MGLFRRRQETLNERLLREAGLDPVQTFGDTAAEAAEPEWESEPEPAKRRAPRRPPFETGDINLGRRGMVESGADEWDAVIGASAPSLLGNEVAFTTLPNGDIVVGAEQGDGDLSPLADAVEAKIDRPYTATASRAGPHLWMVGARRIQVAQVELAEGSEIELTQNDGSHEVRVDGEPSNATVPELVRLGRQQGPNYCVEATRIDGDFWEVRATAL